MFYYVIGRTINQRLHLSYHLKKFAMNLQLKQPLHDPQQIENEEEKMMNKHHHHPNDSNNSKNNNNQTKTNNNNNNMKSEGSNKASTMNSNDMTTSTMIDSTQDQTEYTEFTFN